MFNTEYGQMFNTEYGLPQYQPYQPVYGETGEGCGAGSICINVLIKSVNVMLSISSSSSVLFSGVSDSGPINKLYLTLQLFPNIKYKC